MHGAPLWRVDGETVKHGPILGDGSTINTSTLRIGEIMDRILVPFWRGEASNPVAMLAKARTASEAAKALKNMTQITEDDLAQYRNVVDQNNKSIIRVPKEVKPLLAAIGWILGKVELPEVPPLLDCEKENREKKGIVNKQKREVGREKKICSGRVQNHR